MIHNVTKENARLSIVGGIQTLVAVLANFDKRYDTLMNDTDAATFHRLTIIRADVDALISALGLDRVVLDPQTKEFRWSDNDQSPDGQWRSQGYGHETTNWKGYYLQVRAKPGKFPDVEWLIHKDGECVLRGLVVRLPNVNTMEEAKAAVLLAVKTMAEETESLEQKGSEQHGS